MNRKSCTFKNGLLLRWKIRWTDLIYLDFWAIMRNLCFFSKSPLSNQLWWPHIRRQPITCKHALINNAGSTDEHCITGHDGPVAGDDDDIAGDQVCGQGFLCFCTAKTEDKERERERGEIKPVRLSRSLITHASLHRSAYSSWLWPLRQAPWCKQSGPAATWSLQIHLYVLQKHIPHSEPYRFRPCRL